MKIAIIGAGAIGVCTAYELAADGHQVTVFERRSAAAEEASFAHTGLIGPWATPGLAEIATPSLFRRPAPFQLRWPLSCADLAWLWQWRKAQQPSATLVQRARLQRLTAYSRERLHTLSHKLPLEHDRSDGALVLLRSVRDARLAAPSLQALRDAGLPFSQIDTGAARQIEPALCADTSFFGAIHLPDAEASNCRQATLLLKAAAQQRGAKFEQNSTVTHITPAPAATVSIANESTPRPFDAVVVCAGLASAALLKPLGLRLPLTAVYGYSITANIREPLNAPTRAVLDAQHRVAIVRMGQRVRVAGGAEIGGHPDRKNSAAIASLYKVLHDWFPGAAQHNGTAQEWKAARPLLPDGAPLLGASGLPGIWLNLGHGGSGWAQACGSARATADLLAGRTPEMDMDGFGIERLQR